MSKGLYALMLVGTLMVTQIAPTLGEEETTQLGVMRQDRTQAQSRGQLQLPPVPYLESMPWLNSRSASKRIKTDYLLDPKFEVLGPFLAQLMVSPVRPSSAASSVTPTDTD
jgi:hypothetical protein